MHTAIKVAAGAAALATTLSTVAVGAATAGQTGTRAGTRAQQTVATAPEHTKTLKLKMTPSSPQLAHCYPKTKAYAYVDLTTDKVGFDTVTIAASGLRPKTDFTLFFLEKASFPFGAAEYFGDFTTDKYGKAKASFRLIAEEAFALDIVRKTRTDLNSIGFWFADEKADDGCLGAKSPVTPFDGDAKAGVQMMNTGSRVLP